MAVFWSIVASGANWLQALRRSSRRCISHLWWMPMIAFFDQNHNSVHMTNRPFSFASVNRR
jgi:hypothetical protein